MRPLPPWTNEEGRLDAISMVLVICSATVLGLVLFAVLVWGMR